MIAAAATSNYGTTGLAVALQPPQEPIFIHPLRSALAKYLAAAMLLAAILWVALAMGTLGGQEPFEYATVALATVLSLHLYLRWRKIPVARARHADLHANWQRRLFRWNCLVYCHRCDAVTDAESGRAAPSNGVHLLLEA